MSSAALEAGRAGNTNDEDAICTDDAVAPMSGQTSNGRDAQQQEGAAVTDLPSTSAPIPMTRLFKQPGLPYSASLKPIDTSHKGHPAILTSRASPLSAELRLDTHVSPRKEPSPESDAGFGSHKMPSPDHVHRTNTAAPSTSAGPLPVRSSSVRSLSAAHYTGGSLSPASVMSSPGVGPLLDMTPLPSPLGSASVSWMEMPGIPTPSPLSPVTATSASPTASISPPSPPRKRKAYGPMVAANAVVHGHASHSAANAIHQQPRGRSGSSRSLSEYVPTSMGPRIKATAVSGSHAMPPVDGTPKPMHREEYVAPQRGINPTSAPVAPPTPPSSNRGPPEEEEGEPGSAPSSPQPKPSSSVYERYEARLLKSDKIQQWTAVRKLGTGTFSTVMLATSDPSGAGKNESELDPKSLVAVKICEHGPAGGADEKKIESSLKRELEILKCISHPSLVRLRAVNVVEKRALLVLDYSAGGDLFELASLKVDILVPALVRRIFAELVSAVTYLHEKQIVHRDIKLENVIINPPLSQLTAITDYQTYPSSLVTLTDLGLGRFIPQPPASPLLSTRCGSEDYAAPELLMGQEYDGRLTDAWALGVLLYALVEGRLPFDPVPGRRKQSPVTHRIARCEWGWENWGDGDGEWNFAKEGAAEREGARVVVEGLLRRKRERWSLKRVRDEPWVRGGMQLPGGGLPRRYVEDEDDATTEGGEGAEKEVEEVTMSD